MKMEKKKIMGVAVVAALSAAAIAGCAGMTSGTGNADADALALMKAAFKSQGPVDVDVVLSPDDAMKMCSRYENTAPAGIAKEIEATEMKSIKAPADGKYMGDWMRGEVVAQTGVGMQFSDKVGAANGGNCYACHQISPKEISYGNIGPSLLHYGKLRGNSQPIVQYTWGKIYDAQAYNACSLMPRFGHNGVLTEQQMKDVVALLLDSASPVNQ